MCVCVCVRVRERDIYIYIARVIGSVREKEMGTKGWNEGGPILTLKHSFTINSYTFLIYLSS